MIEEENLDHQSCILASCDFILPERLLDMKIHNDFVVGNAIIRVREAAMVGKV